MLIRWAPLWIGVGLRNGRSNRESGFSEAGAVAPLRRA